MAAAERGETNLGAQLVEINDEMIAAERRLAPLVAHLMKNSGNRALRASRTTSIYQTNPCAVDCLHIVAPKSAATSFQIPTL